MPTILPENYPNPGQPGYGGWTLPTGLNRRGILHFFPSPYASSACFKYRAARQGVRWLDSAHLNEPRCASCSKRATFWDVV